MHLQNTISLCMTTNEKVARRKLSLLELAKELNNVSKVCKLIGCVFR
ncbi:hypothetical protein ACK335_06485 [Aeromonas veronii]